MSQAFWYSSLAAFFRSEPLMWIFAQQSHVSDTCRWISCLLLTLLSLLQFKWLTNYQWNVTWCAKWAMRVTSLVGYQFFLQFRVYFYLLCSVCDFPCAKLLASLCIVQWQTQDSVMRDNLYFPHPAHFYNSSLPCLNFPSLPSLRYFPLLPLSVPHF